MSIALCLIALALGYKVFADALKEKKGVRLLGWGIGIFVMLAAVLSLVCGAIKCAYKSGCPTMSKYSCPMVKANCPMGVQAGQ